MKEYKKIHIIKNAFVGENKLGASASVDIVDDINNTDSMLKITQELNLPISCFVKPTNNENEFQIRYFIYNGEEPICGHGTLITTKVLDELGYIKNSNKVTYIPMLTPDKPIKAEVNGEFVSIFIKTVEPNEVNFNTNVAKQIISSISSQNSDKIFNVVDIVEGDLDYTVEITKNNTNLTSEEIIKEIRPNFEAIEKIKLSTGKLCRGIDVVIKNDEVVCDSEKMSNSKPNFITRIFLPLGADSQYKEDPACGSGGSYVTRYLMTKYPNLKGKELKIYQASKAGAFMKTQSQDNGIIKVSGIVR